ncbi:hypothetical protein TRVA0_007S01222 [Trichomonascus vanleenenianus]|uniref:uncharacterized protein n=1 Tax=Trichomonascus vanleenenianus TaxID=2268995 RepID=UPI003ECB46D2
MDSVKSISWRDVTVEAPKSGATILDGVSGIVRPGEIMALMGPSGCGKTTLLNVLAYRSKLGSEGSMRINNTPATKHLIQQLSSYVEQEDSLIGSLTVRETIDFAAQLYGMKQPHRKSRVDELIKWFGLEDQAGTIIGTPINKGISGGQKRRVSVACQLITQPQILFLDEVTSGLDSKASYEAISRIKQVAKAENMIVIASIHQPSTVTLNLFDKVAFLTKGKPVYFGPTQEIASYFESIGHAIPRNYNVAEYVLDLINTDFSLEQDDPSCLIESIHESWLASGHSEQLDKQLDSISQYPEGPLALTQEPVSAHVRTLSQTWILLRRLFIKSKRDLLAYYVRFAMYMGLAVLMGTVWLRLGSEQQNIQPFINAIFFSGAFMSFMAVAYIPAYLEDFQAYKKDSDNGLYGPTAFMLSNFLIGVPFLFALTVLFSVFTYFMVNFRHSATGFFRYVMWLFLDLIAAESLVVLVSSLAPIFVVALALVAFANGLWMSVGGFLVSADILNVFWYYTFYWINYQRYVFQGMMFNEFETRVFECDSNCHCMYSSPLEDSCQIAGDAVLTSLGYKNNHTGEWVGLLVVIIFAYRLGAWAVLEFKNRFR